MTATASITSVILGASPCMNLAMAPMRTARAATMDPICFSMSYLLVELVEPDDSRGQSRITPEMDEVLPDPHPCEDPEPSGQHRVAGAGVGAGDVSRVAREMAAGGRPTLERIPVGTPEPTRHLHGLAVLAAHDLQAVEEGLLDRLRGVALKTLALAPELLGGEVGHSVTSAPSAAPASPPIRGSVTG